MIEIGERSKHAISYEEAVLYIFCLGDGWRLPTPVEYHGNKHIKCSYSWHRGRTKDYKWHVTPVRDLKDD